MVARLVVRAHPADAPLVAPLALVGGVDAAGGGAGARTLAALGGGGGGGSTARVELVLEGGDGTRSSGGGDCDAEIVTVCGDDGAPRVSLLRLLRADAASDVSVANALAAAAAALLKEGGAKQVVLVAAAHLSQREAQTGGVWIAQGDGAFAPQLGGSASDALGAVASGELPPHAPISDGAAAAFAHFAAVAALPCALALAHAGRGASAPRVLLDAAAAVASLSVDEEVFAAEGTSPTPTGTGFDERDLVYM